ncbi:hypothetical protein AVEN_150440-1 [Araneus ventricosus]|uniref:Uncharacterized protein n=1 Tax=Araneus ventricosus TaxID=182803 RepID=A0A4Y2PEI7_ARAVE|nr:hypothetical protein AVEN_150440-1 [Araneus ventricosus]
MNAVSIPGSEELEDLSPSCIKIVQLLNQLEDMVLSGLDTLLDRTSNPEDPDPERLIQTDSCPMSLCLQPIQLLNQLEDMGPSGLDRKFNPEDPERLILTLSIR